MSTATQATDLHYSIAKATENIKKATALRLTGLAQQIRRERTALRAQLAELEAASL